MRNMRRSLDWARGVIALTCMAAVSGCGDGAAATAPETLTTAAPTAPALSITTSNIAVVGGIGFGFTLGDCSGTFCSRTVGLGEPGGGVSAVFSNGAVRLGGNGKLYRMIFGNWSASRTSPTYSWGSSGASAYFDYCHPTSSGCILYGPHQVTASWSIAEVPALATSLVGSTSITEAGTYHWYTANTNAESGETFTYLWERSTNGPAWTTVGTASVYSRSFATGDVSFQLRLTMTSNYGRSVVVGTSVSVASTLDPSLTISILGPTDIVPGEQCLWTADVTGGTGPYTYTWSTAHADYEQSSGDSFIGGADHESQMRIDVNVTDTNSGFGSASLYVDLDYDAPSCM